MAASNQTTLRSKSGEIPRSFFGPLLVPLRDHPRVRQATHSLKETLKVFLQERGTAERMPVDLERRVLGYFISFYKRYAPTDRPNKAINRFMLWFTARPAIIPSHIRDPLLAPLLGRVNVAQAERTLDQCLTFFINLRGAPENSYSSIEDRANSFFTGLYSCSPFPTEAVDAFLEWALPVSGASSAGSTHLILE